MKNDFFFFDIEKNDFLFESITPQIFEHHLIFDDLFTS